MEDAPPYETEVTVIGGGIAGWTAARRAQQAGAKVTLLERGSAGPGWSNSLLSGGRVHAAYRNPRLHSPGDLFEYIKDKTSGKARDDVARAFSEHVVPALDYLVSEGAEFESLGPQEYLHTTLQGRNRDDDVYQPWDRGPHRLLTKMWRSFLDANGVFLSPVRAKELEREEGRWRVAAEWPDGTISHVFSRAVVMADGGFQANAELVQRNVTRHSYRPLGSNYDVGDCLRMARNHGAEVFDMGAFYGNLGLRDSLHDRRLDEAPPPTELIDAAIVVNAAGERVGDEGLGDDEWSVIDIRLATDVARTESPDCWVIFDNRVWETTGRSDELNRRNRRDTGITLNPFLIEIGATLLQADSLDGLALHTGMPSDHLRTTVQQFNAFCEGGAPLDPVRTGAPGPLVKPPFYALPLLVGIYFTMGGLLVNGYGQVLNDNEQPIEGLYAAGGTMGGLSGGPDNGYVGGWSEAFTFGFIAGGHAAQTENHWP